jgi:hypothetical protein
MLPPLPPRPARSNNTELIVGIVASVVILGVAIGLLVWLLNPFANNSGPNLQAASVATPAPTIGATATPKTTPETATVKPTPSVTKASATATPKATTQAAITTVKTVAITNFDNISIPNLISSYPQVTEITPTDANTQSSLAKYLAALNIDSADLSLTGLKASFFNSADDGATIFQYLKDAVKAKGWQGNSSQMNGLSVVALFDKATDDVILIAFLDDTTTKNLTGTASTGGTNLLVLMGKDTTISATATAIVTGAAASTAKPQPTASKANLTPTPKASTTTAKAGASKATATVTVAPTATLAAGSATSFVTGIMNKYPKIKAYTSIDPAITEQLRNSINSIGNGGMSNVTIEYYVTDDSNDLVLQYLKQAAADNNYEYNQQKVSNTNSTDIASINDATNSQVAIIELPDAATVSQFTGDTSIKGQLIVVITGKYK